MDLYARSAPYYDLIYGPIVDYDRESDLLEGVFDRYAGCPVRTILDLGCGTGNHSFVLASRGYDVVGVDRNETFIGLAEAKARGRTDGPRFMLGDMRDLGKVGRFDALICMFGAFGHLPRGEVRDALAGFRERLEPGGVLAFEWWNRPGARDGHQDWLEREGEGIRLIRMGEGRVDTEAHALHITLRHMILRGDRVEERFTERGTMALYELEETKDLLTDAGFHPLAMLDWSRKTLEPAHPDELRVLAVARRDE
ncbi:MAG: class I SAM-dependent methyltransferase [Thermoplasmata archaeon]